MMKLNFSRFSSSSTNSNQAFNTLAMVYKNNSINAFIELPNILNEFYPPFFVSQMNFSQLSLYPTSTNASLLSSFQFSYTDVLAAHLKVKPKYSGPDRVLGFFINKLAPFISCLLTKQYSICQYPMSQLPADWKHAVVSPNFKGKCFLNGIISYESKSCTSVTGKTLESHINFCLLKQFLSSSLLSFS